MSVAIPTPNDNSWADNLIYMEAGGYLPPLAVKEGQDAEAEPAILWGVILTAGISVLAFFLASSKLWPFTLSNGSHPLDPVVLAIVIGMILGHVGLAVPACRPGVQFSIKKLLPWGIILLGVRLDLMDLLALGATGLVLSVLVTGTSIGLAHLLAKPLGVSPKLATLLGVGSGICGGSAIIATAPAIDADERDVAFSVSTVAFLGMIAMFTLPAVGRLLSIDPQTFGLWAGLTIHQTPQAIAAGFSYGPEAGEAATVAKLARVCMLGPAIFAISLVWSRTRARTSPSEGSAPGIRFRRLLPNFVLGFLAMAVLRTLGLFPTLAIQLGEASIFGAVDRTIDLTALAGQASKCLIMISMAALGLGTDLSQFRRTGFKPLIIGIVVSLTSILMILGLLSVIS